ncbi:MAG TPA: hypothetical protein VJA23_06245 [Candidatus Nanoarchaeia archaeon]|nr:hypothetical protein [Candidatus Nanoarchaeia archaeon]
MKYKTIRSAGEDESPARIYLAPRQDGTIFPVKVRVFGQRIEAAPALNQPVFSYRKPFRESPLDPPPPNLDGLMEQTAREYIRLLDELNDPLP